MPDRGRSDAELWPTIRREGLRWYVEAGSRYFGYRRTPWTARWLVVTAKRTIATEIMADA